MERQKTAPLGVGCVCAGNMEEDYVGARARERTARNAGNRRKRWLGRKWRESAKGNPFLNTDGFNIVVYKKGGRWSGRLTDRETQDDHFLWRTYPTEEQAKLAVFDKMMVLLHNRDSP